MENGRARDVPSAFGTGGVVGEEAPGRATRLGSSFVMSDCRGAVARPPHELARAVHRSKREILELVAELAPRPEARAGIRALPERGGEREGRSTPAERALPVSEAAVGSTEGEGRSDRAGALGSGSARMNVNAAPGVASSTSDGAAAVAAVGDGAAPVAASRA